MLNVYKEQVKKFYRVLWFDQSTRNKEELHIAVDDLVSFEAD